MSKYVVPVGDCCISDIICECWRSKKCCHLMTFDINRHVKTNKTIDDHFNHRD